MRVFSLVNAVAIVLICTSASAQTTIRNCLSMRDDECANKEPCNL